MDEVEVPSAKRRLSAVSAINIASAYNAKVPEKLDGVLCRFYLGVL